MLTFNFAIMEFEEFLRSKKIDPLSFKAGDRQRFDEFNRLFSQVHPNSFVQQKLFLINKIRRKYLLESGNDTKTIQNPDAVIPETTPQKTKLR